MAAVAVVGALSLTGIGAFLVGGLVAGMVTGALCASKAASDAGLTGLDYWKVVGLGALTGGIKGLAAGAALALAPYAAEAFIATYFPIGLMAGGTYLTSAALTAIGTFGLSAISTIYAGLKANDVMALSGTNYVQALTGMSDETYNTINSGVSALGAFIITMGMTNPRALNDLKNNQSTINDILLQGKQDLFTAFTPKPTVIQSSTYKDWATIKADHPRAVTKFLQDNKPIGSPIPKNWFDKGGNITIEEFSDGTQVWRYTSAGNETVSYIGGQGALNGYVKFPQEYLHPDQSIAEFNIGHFTGDRAEDKELALGYLQTCGYESIPLGYRLHHDVTDGTMQLVSEDIHSLFTHYGGVYFNK